MISVEDVQMEDMDGTTEVVSNPRNGKKPYKASVRTKTNDKTRIWHHSSNIRYTILAVLTPI